MSRKLKHHKVRVPQAQAYSPDPHLVRALERRFQEGKALELAKDFQGAEKIYREIIAAFERNRFNAATPNAALGYVLLNQKKFEQAEEVLKRSVKLNGDISEGHANLAAVYRLTERWEACLASARRALEIEPKDVESLLNVAEALKETRQFALSVQNFLLVLSLDQDNVDARKGLASNYVSLGETAVSLPMFRKILEMRPEEWQLKSYMLFAMQYEPSLAVQDVLREHREYGKRVRAEVGRPRTEFPNARTTDRRLRIGYISSDFRYHVVMRFVEQVLARHDHEKFEIVLIMTHAKKDKDTERIRKYADKWVEIGELPDEEAAQAIWDLELDILIDLAGHSGATKLPLIARRLAPVQAIWCGYSGTSGIDVVDYIIVDNVLAPPGEARQFCEEPLRLPASYLSFTSNSSLEPGPLPRERNGYITFGCMNNPSKINSHVVSWWARILQAVPDSKILMRYALFVDPLVRERIAKMFRSHGIAPERYQMLEGKADFVSVYQDVDIALDTFPYNGTTTTCEALWMGVPVVAIRGDRFVSRVGASLLTYSGLSDLVAESPEGYIKLATELARNPEHVAELRRQLRPHLQKTPVYNPAAFTEGLEGAYREIFSRWCEAEGSQLLALGKNLASTKISQNSTEVFSHLPI